ncbi:MAG: hypothetical protein IJZ42_10330 [Lachnospiraceae bacterium]|nr:hypothetical protein [Lachnospiraceae bacterium]
MSNKEELFTVEKAFITYASYGAIRTNDSMYPFFLEGLNCIAIRNDLIERGYLKLATIDESIPYYPYRELRKLLSEHGCPVGNSREKVTKNVRENIQQEQLYKYFGYCCYIPTDLGKRFVNQGINYYIADLQLLTIKIIDTPKYKRYTDMEAYNQALEIEKKQVLFDGISEAGSNRIYSKLLKHKKPLSLTYDDDSDSEENRNKILYIKDQIDRDVNMYDEEGAIKYFFSVQDSIVDIIVNKYLSKKLKIIRLDKFDEKDFSENYVVTIPKKQSWYEDLLLWMFATEKICVPSIYGIPLYYFCADIDICYKYKNYNHVRELLYNRISNSAYDIMKYFNKWYPIKILLELDYYFAYHKSYITVKEIAIKEEYEKIIISLMESNLIPAKWKSEFSLYVLVSSYFEDAVFQYKADWLDRQSLDIYIPKYNIAIEYQGIQHYEPIEYFGGEEAYRENRRRDNEKKQKCDDNNVKLLYWPYTQEITDMNLIDLFSGINIEFAKKKKTNYKLLSNSTKAKKAVRHKEKYVIACFNLSGNYIGVYNTIAEAAIDIGVSNTSIGKVLRGERNSAGGYIWKSYNPSEEIPKIINVGFDISLTNAGKSYVVEQYTADGKLLGRYDSVTDAEKETNISRDSIKKVINGKAKTAGGYIWKKIK